MPEIIFCPSCRGQLQVPAELLGQAVQCPACGQAFTVSSGARTPPASAAGGEPAPVRRAAPTPPTEGVMGLLLPPALCLMLLSLPGLLLSALMLLPLLTGDVEEMRAGMQRNAPADPQQQKIHDMLTEFLTGSGGIALHATSMAFDLLIILGAIMMMARRAYFLALLAGLLALINIGNCCCFLEMPCGLWALIVLLMSNVRAAFR